MSWLQNKIFKKWFALFQEIVSLLGLKTWQALQLIERNASEEKGQAMKILKVTQKNAKLQKGTEIVTKQAKDRKIKKNNSRNKKRVAKTRAESNAVCEYTQRQFRPMVMSPLC